ncbi:hypothetical protein BST61_g5461 [Cercospora zeina]
MYNSEQGFLNFVPGVRTIDSETSIVTMHRPTILLCFISFIYTTTATVKYHCNDYNDVNYNNCGRADSAECLVGCASNCGAFPQSYAGQAAADNQICNRYCIP